jgi:hypothetical protein
VVSDVISRRGGARCFARARATFHAIELMLSRGRKHRVVACNRRCNRRRLQRAGSMIAATPDGDSSDVLQDAATACAIITYEYAMTGE